MELLVELLDDLHLDTAVVESLKFDNAVLNPITSLVHMTLRTGVDSKELLGFLCMQCDRLISESRASTLSLYLHGIYYLFHKLMVDPVHVNSVGALLLEFLRRVVLPGSRMCGEVMTLFQLLLHLYFHKELDSQRQEEFHLVFQVCVTALVATTLPTADDNESETKALTDTNVDILRDPQTLATFLQGRTLDIYGLCSACITLVEIGCTHEAVATQTLTASLWSHTLAVFRYSSVEEARKGCIRLLIPFFCEFNEDYERELYDVCFQLWTNQYATWQQPQFYEQFFSVALHGSDRYVNFAHQDANQSENAKAIAHRLSEQVLTDVYEVLCLRVNAFSRHGDEEQIAQFLHTAMLVGLFHRLNLLRKHGMFLLKAALHAAQKKNNPVLQASVRGYTLQQWSAFIAVFESSEDCEAHLVRAVWPKIESLFAGEGMLSWVELVLSRLVFHRQGPIQRMVTYALFDGKTPLFRVLPQHISEKFLFTCVVPSIDASSLYTNTAHKNFPTDMCIFFEIFLVAKRRKDPANVAGYMLRLLTALTEVKSHIAMVHLLKAISTMHRCSLMNREDPLPELTNIWTAESIHAFRKLLIIKFYDSSRILRFHMYTLTLKFFIEMADVKSFSAFDFGDLIVKYPRELLLPCTDTYTMVLQAVSATTGDDARPQIELMTTELLKDYFAEESKYTTAKTAEILGVLSLYMRDSQVFTNMLSVMRQRMQGMFSRTYLPVGHRHKTIALLRELLNYKTREWIVDFTATPDVLEPYALHQVIALEPCSFEGQPAAVPNLHENVGAVLHVVQEELSELLSYLETVLWTSDIDNIHFDNASMSQHALELTLMLLHDLTDVDTIIAFRWKNISRAMETLGGSTDLLKYCAAVRVLNTMITSVPLSATPRHLVPTEGGDAAAFLDTLFVAITKLKRVPRDAETINGELRQYLNGEIETSQWCIMQVLLRFDSLKPEDSVLLEVLEKCGDAIDSASFSYVSRIFDCTRIISHKLIHLEQDKLLVPLEQILLQGTWFLEALHTNLTIYTFNDFMCILFGNPSFQVKALHMENGMFRKVFYQVYEIAKNRPIYATSFALSATVAWSSHPEIALLYAKEILEVSTFFPIVTTTRDIGSSMYPKTMMLNAKQHESMETKLLDAEVKAAKEAVEMKSMPYRGFLGDHIVRMAGLAYIESVIQHEDKKFANELIQNIVNELLTGEPYGNIIGLKRPRMKVYKIGSPEYLRECYLFQLLIMASTGLNDAELLDVLMKQMWKLLNENVAPGIRHMIEVVIASILIRFPERIDNELLPRLGDKRTLSSVLVSYLLLAGVCLTTSEVAMDTTRRAKLVGTLARYISFNQGHIRVLAQFFFWAAVEDIGEVEVPQDAVSTAVINGVYQHMVTDKDSKHLRKAQKVYFDEFNLVKRLSLQGMFQSTVEATGWVPQNLFDNLKKIQAPTLSKHLVDFDPPPPEVQPEVKVAHVDVTAPSTWAALETANKQRQVNATSSNFEFENFQKKVRVGAQNIEHAYDGAFMVERMRDLVEETHAKAKQELIVVASLIDKTANLGGLARTCEIFNVKEITMDDKRVINDKLFKQVSVTAGGWVPITEVKKDLDSIAAFLREKRQAGWTVVAVEQTANSVSLEDYKFPQKVVLLLGKEREGMPIELLKEVDHCVEIPQFGLIRSLNVHVCASLMIWECTRQRLCGQLIQHNDKY